MTMCLREGMTLTAFKLTELRAARVEFEGEVQQLVGLDESEAGGARGGHVSWTLGLFAFDFHVLTRRILCASADHTCRGGASLNFDMNDDGCSFLNFM